MANPTSQCPPSPHTLQRQVGQQNGVPLLLLPYIGPPPPPAQVQSLRCRTSHNLIQAKALHGMDCSLTLPGEIGNWTQVDLSSPSPKTFQSNQSKQTSGSGEVENPRVGGDLEERKGSHRPGSQTWLPAETTVPHSPGQPERHLEVLSLDLIPSSSDWQKLSVGLKRTEAPQVSLTYIEM